MEPSGDFVFKNLINSSVVIARPKFRSESGHFSPLKKSCSGVA
jgi:hypothetical protein